MCITLTLLTPWAQVSIAYATSSYYLIPVNSDTQHWTNFTQTKAQGSIDAYLVHTNIPDVEVLLPPPQVRLVTTSEQAKRNSCTVAVNGGPFNQDGTPVGAVWRHGEAENNEFSGVGFGITRPPHRRYIVGTLSGVQQAKALRVDNLLTGFDWLVQHGQNVANGRNNTTGSERAPRTAVAVDKHGRLMVYVSDGCQLCVFFFDWW